MSEAHALLALQNADLEILRAKKKLESLPERQKIVACKAKSKEVALKRAKVVDMKDDIDQKIAKLQGEDEQLKEKVAETQASLDATKDYRQIAHLTRDMEGMIKRREKLDFELGGLLERADKIEGVKQQADTALESLDAQEKEYTEAFRRNVTELQERIEELTQARNDAAAQLSPALLEHYTKSAKAHAGIGAGALEGRICSVCHVEFQQGQLARIQAGGEITTCPNCNRILINLKDDSNGQE